MADSKLVSHVDFLYHVLSKTKKGEVTDGITGLGRRTELHRRRDWWKGLITGVGGEEFEEGKVGRTKLLALSSGRKGRVEDRALPPSEASTG